MRCARVRWAQLRESMLVDRREEPIASRSFAPRAELPRRLWLGAADVRKYMTPAAYLQAVTPKRPTGTFARHLASQMRAEASRGRGGATMRTRCADWFSRAIARWRCGTLRIRWPGRGTSWSRSGPR